MIHGPLGFCSLHPISFFDWALLRCGLSPFHLAHIPFYPTSIGWLTLLPCTTLLLVEMSLILLRFSYFWAYKLKHLPCQFLISFLLSGFTSQHSRWASPFCALGILGPFHSLCILGPFHSSLPLSLSWVFAKPFGLPWPNYHILAF